MKVIIVQQGVCHIVALPIYIKKYLKAKEKFMETQIFHHAKNIILKKKSSKGNQNPSRYYNTL